MGSLQQAFEKPKSLKEATILLNTEQTYEGFTIQTDSIKMLTANGHTSYIFTVKPTSPRAYAFQNLTIDESSSGTKVFVNTYTPTKKWIANWKMGKVEKFEGNIDVVYLNQETSSNSNLSKQNISKNNTALVALPDDGCTSTTYYETLAYSCGSGQHSPGDTRCALTGSDAAGYYVFEYTITNCGGSQGGGGGGGTSPTPPGTYNPCDEGIPYVSSMSNNTLSSRSKLMVAPLPTTPCDELPKDCAGVPGGKAYNSDCGCIGGSTGIEACPKEIIDSVQNPCIKAQVNLALTAKTTILTMLNNTFGGTVQFEDLSLTFKDVTTLPNNLDGQQTRGSTTSVEFTIELNKNTLPAFSKEYILSTIYHEILHAYLEGHFNKDGSGTYIISDDHQEMARNYVTLMSGALQIAFPNLNSQEAWALSWSGLEKTSLYSKLSQEQKKAVADINTRFKNNALTNKLGTYCAP